jgi:hypothetical protein
MTTQHTTVAMRRCIGSTRFGIESHKAPADDIPPQPSQKDGLGRMCHTHWRACTNALRKAAVARKAEETTDVPAPEPEPAVIEAPEEAPEPEVPAPRKTRRAKATAEPTEADDDER